MQKRNLIVYVFLGSVILAVAGFISGFLLEKDQVSSIELSHHGQSIQNSIYTRYQGKIYASVPSNGDYVIPQADPQSFHSLNSDGRYQNRQFAVDQQYAYCGNLVVAGFNPKKTQALDHNYFSDGQNTVYCASMSQRNPDLSGFSEIKQTWLYGWGFANKPQTYIYEQVRLAPSAQPYTAILDADILSNGQKVYYKGLEMPEANPAQLSAIVVPQDDQSIRLSYEFFKDHKSVYFKHNKLALASNDQLYSFYIDGLDQAYLYDPTQGQVFVDHLAFNKKLVPYQVMSHYGGHVNHALFLSKSGVYYYENQTKQIERAADNPFNMGQWQEISPLIFSYNNQTYFLQGSERWGGRKGPGLISRSTHLYQLEDAATGPWEKVANVTTHHYAEVWKKGNQYYYFDRLGSTQLIQQTLYLIADRETLNYLIHDELRPDDIRQLVRNDKLLAVKAKEILKATTQYRKLLFGFIALPF